MRGDKRVVEPLIGGRCLRQLGTRQISGRRRSSTTPSGGLLITALSPVQTLPLSGAAVR